MRLFVDRGDGRLGQRLRFHEPLLGDQRLDDRLAAVAFAEAERVILDLVEKAELFQIGDDALAGFEAIEARRRGRRRRSSSRPRRSPGCAGRLWRLPASKSLGSCAGVTFTTPVPNSGSAMSSRMMGISRSISGSWTVWRHAGRGSARRRALMATAVSPSMVSGRVVATIRNRSGAPFACTTG